MRHIISNISLSEINNSILLVLEYPEDQNFTINIYTISSYDEIEDSLDLDTTEFPLLNDIEIDNDNFKKHNMIVESMKNLYCNGNLIQINISIYDIISKLDTAVCIEDFDNNHIVEFAKKHFHIDYPKEHHFFELSKNKKNILAKFFFDEYLSERKTKLGF